MLRASVRAFRDGGVGKQVGPARLHRLVVLESSLLDDGPQEPVFNGALGSPVVLIFWAASTSSFALWGARR